MSFLCSRSEVPVFWGSLSDTISSIINGPLPIETSSVTYTERSKIPSCKVIIICFNGISNIEAPLLDNVRKIARFTNITMVDYNVQDDLMELNSLLLSIIHGDGLNFEKIILFDFLQLFELDDDDKLKTPVLCYNFRYLINIINLVTRYKDFVHLIESHELFQHSHSVIPRKPYLTEESFHRDFTKFMDHDKEVSSEFVDLQKIFYNLGFVMVKDGKDIFK